MIEEVNIGLIPFSPHLDAERRLPVTVNVLNALAENSAKRL
jgi:hypothetical protein